MSHPSTLSYAVACMVYLGKDVYADVLEDEILLI
jgi:hypothetical protein